jgi:hypothetical protein
MRDSADATNRTAEAQKKAGKEADNLKNKIHGAAEEG